MVSYVLPHYKLHASSRELTEPDPSLHRLSTQAEISAIKRRAAPKLFRTRRLANGQVVRTRAGPSVQAKFHEIRDEMAESRRVRTLQSNTTVGLQPSGGGRDHTFDGVDHSHGGVIAGGRSLESGLTNVIHPQSPTRTFFWDRGRDRVEAQRLECIEEGVASSWASSFDFPPIHSLPVTSNVYRQGTSSFSAATPNNTYESHDSVLGHTQQGQHPGDGSTTKVSGMGMAVQSCPASIHTSPVLRSAELPPMAHALAPQHAHPNVVPHHMFSASLQHMPSHPLPTPQQLGLAFDQGPFPFRIAEPAAPNPFALSISPIHETPAHHRDSVASALSALSNLSTPSSAVSEYQGDQANASWHGDTIDPRWVSPATSQWSTPAVTPRSGSPVNLAGVPQHAHGY